MTTKAAPKSATPNYQQTVEAMTGASGEAMRKTYDRSLAMMSEAAEISKKNFEAYSASVAVASKSVEALNQRAFSYFKASMETSMQATRELSTAKTMKDFLELQAEYTKKAFETYVEEANTVNGLVQTMVKDAVQPVTAQAGEVVAFMQRRA
jgi:phasin family protein